MPAEKRARSRLRLHDFRLERFPDGRCEVTVNTEWTGGRFYRGVARGIQTREGEIRAAAEATLIATAEAVNGALDLTLLGGKAMRAFDSWLVVVSLRAEVDGDSFRLLGAYPCPDENTPLGAVLAVLDGTNRIVARYLPE